LLADIPDLKPRVSLWSRRTIVVTIRGSETGDPKQNALTGVADMSREQLRACVEIGGGILLLSPCLLFFFPFG
jgi:hypothetical protein